MADVKIYFSEKNNKNEIRNNKLNIFFAENKLY